MNAFNKTGEIQRHPQEVNKERRGEIIQRNINYRKCESLTLISKQLLKIQDDYRIQFVSDVNTAVMATPKRHRLFILAPKLSLVLTHFWLQMHLSLQETVKSASSFLFFFTPFFQCCVFLLFMLTLHQTVCVTFCLTYC